MQTCLIPFIIWNMALDDPKILKYLKWAFIVSITISGIYGLILTRLEGLNPYTSFLANYFDKVDSAEIYASSTAAVSRLSFSSAGKIQSTMVHPMTWGLLLCFLLIIFTTSYFKTKIKTYWLVIGLIGFNILISGVRTGIAALAVGSIYFLIRYRKFKLIIFALLFVSVFAIVIQSNEDLSKLFASFTDVSGTNSEVKGSSISMRLDQLQGAIHEINGIELVGKGYGWNSYYISKHGDHPVLLAFESLVFVVLCNNGIIG
ncbi:MAG TPA: O-antigen ligase family protein, partial [Prolixibacteraceae bacterium]